MNIETQETRNNSKRTQALSGNSYLLKKIYELHGTELKVIPRKLNEIQENATRQIRKIRKIMLMKTER